MREMMKFFKLCKYSYKFSTNMIFLVLFFFIGVINEVATKGTSYLGGFYIVLCSIYMFQFVMSLSMSDMIQASGIGRRIHLDMPVKLNVALSLILYTLLVIYRICMTRAWPDQSRDIAASLLMINLLFGVLFIYTAIVYKYFLVSVLIFSITFAFVMTGYNLILMLPGMVVNLKTAVISGYIIILVGAVLQYLICLMLSKKPISQRAFRGIFKDAK